MVRPSPKAILPLISGFSASISLLVFSSSSGKSSLENFLVYLRFSKNELAISADLQFRNAQLLGNAAGIQDGSDILDAQIEAGIGILDLRQSRLRGLNRGRTVLFGGHRRQSPVYQILCGITPGQYDREKGQPDELHA